jgi:predicted amidohydrolase
MLTQLDANPLLARFSKLAAELQVVLPVSFFEKAGNAYYNTVMMFDADGSNMGLYRKSHIPDGPGYQEKFYFNPGDTVCASPKLAAIDMLSLSRDTLLACMPVPHDVLSVWLVVVLMC